MATAFTTPQARQLIATNLKLDSGAAKQHLDSLEFLDFPDLEKNVKADVDFLRTNGLVKGTKIRGFVYDVKTGALKEVA